jgi:hypothetical protein
MLIMYESNIQDPRAVVPLILNISELVERIARYVLDFGLFPETDFTVFLRGGLLLWVPGAGATRAVQTGK